MHDGFTLADLVSYEHKHNEANGEDNRDGSDDNNSTQLRRRRPDRRSQPSSTLRRQLRRNQLASLLLAQGVPLILAGDEVGNSQGGNNNAYCQDNEIGWVDWSALGRDGEDMTEFVGELTRLRQRFPQLRAAALARRPAAPTARTTCCGCAPTATEMTEQDWNFPEGRFLSYVLGAGRDRRRAALHRASMPRRRRSSSRCRPGRASRAGRRVLDTAADSVLAEDDAEAPGAQAHGAAALDPGVRGQAMSDGARFGPLIAPDGVTFRLWAPARKARRADARRSRTRCSARDDGWFELDGRRRAAPARATSSASTARSRCPIRPRIFSREDVHGPSEVDRSRAIDWQTRDWTGRPWHECVFLELHVGTFTPEGTFRAVIDKLDHIAETGITAIELMPVADFPGRWNWGYDGVLLYAPDSAYGRPDDLKALIDAAHARGLMVFLDVVYNHFGPEGNYLGALRAAVLHAGATRPGAARSTTACRRCAPSRSRMRCIGSTTTASTGCGSMPCMRSSSRASRRSCTS